MDSFCLETVSGSQVPAVGMGTYLPPQLLPSMVCAAFLMGFLRNTVITGLLLPEY